MQKELNRAQVFRLLQQLQGEPGLTARLVYGARLRVLECLRLRIRDLNFERGRIDVYDRRGRRVRGAPLPVALAPALRRQVARRAFEYERSVWGSRLRGKTSLRTAVPEEEHQMALVDQYLMMPPEHRRKQGRERVAARLVRAALRETASAIGLPGRDAASRLWQSALRHRSDGGLSPADLLRLLAHQQPCGYGSRRLGSSCAGFHEIRFQALINS